MKKNEKNHLETVAAILVTMIAREYRIADDQECVIEISTDLRRGVSGVFKTKENRIVIRPINFDIDTLAHELAHWVQFMLFGETECSIMKNMKLAGEHYRIQKEIEAKISEWGYASDIEQAAFAA